MTYGGRTFHRNKDKHLRKLKKRSSLKGREEGGGGKMKSGDTDTNIKKKKLIGRIVFNKT